MHICQVYKFDYPDTLFLSCNWSLMSHATVSNPWLNDFQTQRAFKIATWILSAWEFISTRVFRKDEIPTPLQSIGVLPLTSLRPGFQPKCFLSHKPNFANVHKNQSKFTDFVQIKVCKCFCTVHTQFSCIHNVKGMKMDSTLDQLILPIITGCFLYLAPSCGSS